jgi:hypothetical protein
MRRGPSVARRANRPTSDITIEAAAPPSTIDRVRVPAVGRNRAYRLCRFSWEIAASNVIEETSAEARPTVLAGNQRAATTQNRKPKLALAMVDSMSA